MKSILLISAKYPPAICGVGDHTAILARYLQQQAYRVIVANGTSENMFQQVYRYPETNRVAFLQELVQKESITHVLWQYSPYALHARGTPWWVVKAARALRKMGLQQAVYFHEIQIRYSVPGLFNTWRAFQQQQIAQRLLSICGKAGTSISFYLPYLSGGNPADWATQQGDSGAYAEQNRGLPAGKNKIVLIPVPTNIPVRYIAPTAKAVPAAESKLVETGAGTPAANSYEAYLSLLGINPQEASSFPHTSNEAVSPLAEGWGGGFRFHKTFPILSFANRALPGIVEALATLQKAHPTIEPVWLGHASETGLAALRQKTEALGLSARVTGTQPLEKLAAEIEAAEIVLLPQPLGKKGEGGISLKNGTLSAAMAAGKAIIATRGDMTDTHLLQHGVQIHFVNDNETATWHHAIEHLLQNETYRHQLGQQAYHFYQQHLSMAVVGKAFEEYLTPGPSPPHPLPLSPWGRGVPLFDMPD